MAALVAALVAAACAVAVLSLYQGLTPLRAPGEGAPPVTQEAGRFVESVAMRNSPAGQAMTALAARVPALFPQFTGRLSARGSFISPTPLACPMKETAVYDGWSWFGSRPGRDGAVTVTALVTGPGYAQTVLRQARAALVDCGGSVVTSGAGEFTARSSKIEVRGWAVGDVVLLLTADAVPDTLVTAAQDALSGVTRTLLGPVCADLSASDAIERNPYLGSRFTGNVVTVGYRLSAVPAGPQPAPGTTRQWTAPPPREFPEFAVPGTDPYLPAAGPLLVDPQALVRPPVGEVSEPEPVQPALQERGGVSLPLRVGDPVGPGCGWSFLELAPPPLGYEQISRAAHEQAVEQAVALTATSTQALVDQVRWARQVEATQEDASRWAAVQAYEQALADAQAAVAQARLDWQASLAAALAPTPAAPSSPAVPGELPNEPAQSPEPSGAPESPAAQPAPPPSADPTATPSPTPTAPVTAPTQEATR